MNKRINRIFDFKSASIHMILLLIMVGAFTISIKTNGGDLLALNIISYASLGIMTAFMTFELLYVTISHAKDRKEADKSFVHLFLNYHIRELLFAPVGTLCSMYFAMIHFIVFRITGLWYFSFLNIVYLFGLSIKLYQVHVDEISGTANYKKGLVLSNIAMIVLGLMFLTTVFLTDRYHEVIHEPLFLFVLDIVFFFLKLIFAAVGLISATKYKNKLMFSYSITAFVLAFYSFYSMMIAIFHKSEAFQLRAPG